MSILIISYDDCHASLAASFVPLVLFLSPKYISMRNKLTTSKSSPKPAILCAPLAVTSPVFAGKGSLNTQYTCDGANINPSLDIAGTPNGTKSLAIIMDDIDASGGRFIHWIAWNIAVIPHIKEARTMEAEGLNDYRMQGYRGPCPSFGTHHYTFNIYALDTLLDLHPDTKEPDLKSSMNGHILGYGSLTGQYKRK